MAQIIDIEERRKPRTLPRSRAEALGDPTILDAAAYVDQLMAPIAFWWQSWYATWGSFWLAPLGLQVAADPIIAGTGPQELRRASRLGLRGAGRRHRLPSASPQASRSAVAGRLVDRDRR